MKKFYMGMLITCILLLIPSLLSAQLKVFSESFEEAFPGSWTQDHIIGSTNWVKESGAGLVFPDSTVSGTGRAYFYSPVNVPATTRLVTTSIPTGNLRVPYTLNFYYALPAFGDETTHDTLRIYLSTAGSGNWTLIRTFAEKQDFWTQAAIDVDFDADNVQFAFEGINGGGRGIVLDSITVADIPVCAEKVTGFAVSKITSNTAIIRWGRLSDYAIYSLKVDTKPITDFNAVAAIVDTDNISDNTYSLSGLTPGVKYYFYVKADCGNGDESPWSDEGTFTTACEPAGVINEGFESYENSAKTVDCWTLGSIRINNGTSDGTLNVSSTNPYTGSRSLYVQSKHTTTSGVSVYTKDYVILPELSDTINMKQKQLSFYVSATAGAKIHMGIAKHPDYNNFEDGDFEEITEFTILNKDTYENKIFYLNTYEGEGKYIVLYVQGIDLKAQTTFYFDDFELQDISTDCSSLKMTSLKTDKLTPDSAVISWNTLETNQWNVKISIRSINPLIDSGDFLTKTTISCPDTISGLTPGTAYYYYVQPVCENGIAGSWSDEFLFITEVDDTGITIPYYQSFDWASTTTTNSLDTPFPAGWYRYSDISTSLSEPYNYTLSSAYSSPAVLRVRYSNASGTGKSMFALPKIKNADLKDVQVRFMIKGGDDDLQLVVGVTSDPSDENVFNNYTFIDTINTGVKSTWQEYTVKFNDYQGNDEYIVFMTPQNHSFKAQKTIYIDDLYIEKITDIERPAGFTGILTGNSVELSWESTENSFDVLYGKKGLVLSDPANIIVPVTGTNTIISGLSANMEFDFYVRVNNGNDNVSLWTGPISFTTVQTPAVIPYEAGFSDEADNSQWTFLNASYPNAWYIGGATKKTGGKSMYVSTILDNNSYANVISYIYAYRTVDVTEGGLYDFGFTWKAEGETTNDYMRVFLVPDEIELQGGQNNGISATATPDKWISVGETFNLQTEWNDTVFTHMLTEAGKYKLVFYWANNASVSNPPAAAIDSVFFKKNTNCMVPVNVQINKINDTNAELNFIGYNSDWNFKLSTTEIAAGNLSTVAGDVIDEIITSSTKLLTGLSPETDYYYYLKATCSDEWISGNFTTKCARISLTVTENFDSYGTGTDAFPDCWSKLTNYTTGNYPNISNNGLTAPGALDLYQTASTYNAVVSPLLDIDQLQKVQVKLYGQTPNASHQLIVGAISDPDDIHTFVPVETLKPQAVDTWEFFEVPFDKYTGDAKYIVFLTENLAQHFYIDSVLIEYIPACRTPRELVARDITYESAALSWNGYGASSFNVKVSTISISPETEQGDIFNDVVTDTRFTISKLRPLTTYYWYVQAKCDDNEVSGWSKEVQFETIYMDFALPFRESFDTYGTGSGVRPPYWTAVKVNGNYPYIYSTASNVYSLPGSLAFSGGSATNYQMIATPKLYVDSVKNLTVYFKAKFTSTNGALQIGVMTDANNINTFVKVGEALRIGSSSDYQDYAIDLSEYTGDGKYIAFSSLNEVSTNVIYIDDVVIQHTNMSCEMPTGLILSAITNNSAYITWSVQGVPEYYNLKVSSYPIVPDIEDGDVVNVDSLELRRYSCDSLEPLITYYVYVQVVCDEEDGTSYWASASFTTVCAPENLPYEENFESFETGVGNYPECWISYLHIISGSPAESNRVYPYIDKESTTNNNKVLTLETKYSSGSSGYMTGVDAITPLIADNLSDCQMTFRYRFTGTTRNFPLYVGVVSDWADLSTYVAVDTLYSYGLTDWKTHLLNFSEYPDAKYVVFRIACNENLAVSYKVQIDDILLERIPACAPPYAVRVTDKSSDEITMNWKAGNISSTPWNYILTEKEVDLSLENAVDSLALYKVKEGSATTTSCTITDLQANTDYYFYITAVCGDAYFPVGIKITTECDMKIQVPYFEDFSTYGTSSGLNSSYPTCWYRETDSESSITTYPYIVTKPTAYTNLQLQGNMLNIYSASGSYVYGVMPELYVDSIQKIRIRFKTATNNTSKGKQLHIGVMTSMEDISTFVPVDTIEYENYNVLYEVKVAFDQYTGDGKYIAFFVKDGQRAHIGELYVEENTDCEVPLSPEIVNRTDSTFTLSWGRIADESQWEVRYGPEGFDINGADYISEVVTDTFYTAGNLQQNTLYDVYVRTICGENDASNWSSRISVKTFQIPGILPYFTDFEAVENDDRWIFLNGSSTNQNYFSWAIGSATSTSEGSRALYLSNDGGLTSEYGSTIVASYVFAYTTLAVPAGIYSFSFKWKGEGLRLNYYMRAFLIPDDDEILEGQSNGITSSGQPSGWLPIGGNLYGEKRWMDCRDTLTITATQAGNYKLVFYVRNGSSSSVEDPNPPYAVDSISVVRTAPETPTRLRLESVTETTAVFDWLGYNTDYWELKVYDTPVDIDTDLLTTPVKETDVYTLPVEVDGLQQATRYYLYIKAYGDTTWLSMPFMTSCPATVNTFPVFESFDDETGEYYLPQCWTKYNSLSKDFVPSSIFNEYQYYVPYSADSLYYSGFHTNPGYNNSKGAMVIGGSANYYSMAISPKFEEDELQNINLQFQLRYVTFSVGKLVYGVMENHNDINSFVALDTIQNLSSGWQQINISLRDYDLTGLHAQHFVFMGPQVSGNTFLLIDNLRIGYWEDHEIYDDFCKNYPYRRNGFDIPAGELASTGIHEFTRTSYVSGFGNDSIITLYINVGEDVEYIIEAEICEGEVYDLNGFNETEVGRYSMPYKSSLGCDSIVTLELKVHPKYVFETIEVTCLNSLPYEWRGRLLYDTDIYYDSLKTVNTSCDSIYVLNLSVAREENVSISDRICENLLPYDFNGTLLSETGVYRDTLLNRNGCDSIVTLNLTVDPVYDIRETVTICDGSSYSGYGFYNLITAGEYSHGLTSSSTGCDSIFTLVLRIADRVARVERDTVCIGETYDPGADYSLLTETDNEIVYSKLLSSPDGCDTIVSLFVAKMSVVIISDRVTIGPEDLPFEYADTIFDVGTTSGEYRIVTTTEYGCEKIINLTLIVGTTGLANPYGEYFNITPNPVNRGTSAYINYDFDKADQTGLRVEIFNSAGMLYYQYQPDEYPVNVGKYIKEAGMYMIRITTGNNKVLIGKLIVI